MTTNLQDEAAPPVDVPRLVRLSVFEIARYCHESASLIDGDPCTWEELGRDEQKQALDHIQFRMENPDALISAWHDRENPQGCKWDEVCMWRKIRTAMYHAVANLMRDSELTEQSDRHSNRA